MFVLRRFYNKYNNFSKKYVHLENLKNIIKQGKEKEICKYIIDNKLYGPASIDEYYPFIEKTSGEIIDQMRKRKISNIDYFTSKNFYAFMYSEKYCIKKIADKMSVKDFDKYSVKNYLDVLRMMDGTPLTVIKDWNINYFFGSAFYAVLKNGSNDEIFEYLTFLEKNNIHVNFVERHYYSYDLCKTNKVIVFDNNMDIYHYDSRWKLLDFWLMAKTDEETNKLFLKLLNYDECNISIINKICTSLKYFDKILSMRNALKEKQIHGYTKTLY